MMRAGRGARAAMVVGLLAVVPACRSGAAGAAGAPDLKSDDDKTLYALGISMGGNLAGFGLSAPEIEIVKRGLADGASGTTPAIPFAPVHPPSIPIAPLQWPAFLRHLTTQFSSRAGGEDVEPRQAVMPALSPATTGSAIPQLDKDSQPL